MDGVPLAVHPALASAFPSLLRGVQFFPHPVVVQLERFVSGHAKEQLLTGFSRWSGA
jgi:hypothetical protein